MRFFPWLRSLYLLSSPSAGRRNAFPRQRHPLRSVPLAVEQLETRITPYALSTLASFNGTNGSSPEAGLLMDSSGNLYGTTYRGGASSGGTIFELAHGSGSLTTLVSFNGPNGGTANASGLIMDSSGNLYGTTASSPGTVFELPRGGSLTTLAPFPAGPPYGGDGPNGVTMDSSGDLFGTTLDSGMAFDCVVFELPHGSSSVASLADFGDTTYPNGVIPDSGGNLYGTTAFGGASGEGEVFEVVQGSGTITTLASFNGTNGGYPNLGNGTVGADLVRNSSGNLYGTTYEGGAYGDGTVFELAHGSSTITALASFNGSNGKYPDGSLLLDGSGNLFGTTSAGGASGDGTVFELAQGSGTITTLASFNGTNGSDPVAGLLMDGSGNLYGTTYSGGASNLGTVFELVNGIALSPTTLPPATVGTTYSATLTAVGGTAPYTFAVTAGALPAGLSLSSAGVLSGTPTAGGSFPFTVTATDGSGTTGSQAYTLTVGQPAAALSVTGFPSPTTAGLAGTITVTALNANGATDIGYLGTIHFTSSDPQAALPANYTFTAADQGMHTFTATLKTAGTQSIAASDTANNSIVGSDTGVTVNPAAAASLVFSNVPSSTTAGSSFTLIVTAKDAYGNVATGYTGTVHFSSSDAKAVLPANYTFTSADAGQHTFFIALKTAGTQSVTVTDTVTSSFTATAGGIDVIAAAAAKLVLSAPSSVAHGVAFSVTLTVEDAYGNVVTGYTGTVHFSSSDSTATLPANYTFTAADAGVHTFNKVILRKRGKQTLTVTDTLNSALTITDTISVL